MTHDNDKVLLVATNTGKMGHGGPDTGLWLSEFAGPYYALRDQGYHVDVASPQGGAVPLDPRSKPGLLKSSSEPVRRFADDDATQKWLEGSLPLSEVNDEYRAIVCCGGHGAMFDFPYCEPLSKLLVRMNNRGAIVGAICHGPAAFVGAIHPSGESIVHGRPLTCFSDAEDRDRGAAEHLPFLLESRLRELGAEVQVGEPGGELVVTDGNLVTAQGPGAVAKFGEQLVALLHQQNMARRGSLGQHGLAAGG